MDHRGYVAAAAICAALALAACDNRSESEKRLDHLQAKYESDIRDIRANAIGEMEERERGGSSDGVGSQKSKLRDKARTDPKAADAEAIARMPRNEVLATAINSAGYLCAKVRDTYSVSGGVMVDCTEYRSGSGRAKYRIDTTAMEVSKIE